MKLSLINQTVDKQNINNMNQYSQWHFSRQRFRSMASETQKNIPLASNKLVLNTERQRGDKEQKKQKRHIEQQLFNVEIDYRTKTFELMKRNTELQLTANQSKIHIDKLSQEIDSLKKQVQELIVLNLQEQKVVKQKHLGTSSIYFKKQDLCRDSSINTYHTHSLSSGVDSFLGEKFKKGKQNQFLKSTIDNLRNRSELDYNFTINQEAIETQYNTNEPKEIYQSPEQIFSGYYEQGMNQILQEYKKIIKRQHQKNTQIQKKVKHHESSIKKAKDKLKQKEKQIADLTEQNMNKLRRIEQYQQQLRKNELTHQTQNNMLKTTIEELQHQNQQLDSQIKKLESQLKEFQQKSTTSHEEKDKKIQHFEEYILEIEKQIDIEKGERKKLQNRYHQEIKHFEEMEDLVEKKLIEVQYEMNHYKSEKKKSEQRIRELENLVIYFQKKYGDQDNKELDEDRLPAFGKISEKGENSLLQKLYYSFGDQSDQQNQNTIPEQKTMKQNQQQPMSKKEQKSSEEIEEDRKKQVQSSLQFLKSMSNDTVPLAPQKNQSLTQFPQIVDSSANISEVEKQSSSHLQSVVIFQKKEDDDRYQLERQCYEESIKTLLRQNDRLKKMMITYYTKMNKLFGNSEFLGEATKQDKQIEMEIKILMSAMEI